MNNKLITSAWLFVCFLISSSAFAQRIIDLEAILVSPTDGLELKSREQFNIVIQLKNNGPDDLKKGDTLVVGVREEVFAVLLAADIPQSENAIIFERSTAYEVNGGSSATFSFCVEILDINSNGVSTSPGVPLLVSYDDPHPTNNLTCNEITISSAGSSSIDQAGSGQNSVNIFPNPAVGHEVTIQIGRDYTDELIVRITDISGRVLQEQKYNAAAVQRGRLSLNIEQLPAGVFIVNLQSGTKTVAERLTVIR